MEDMSEAQPQFETSVDVKLNYIQRDLREMKSDLKDIKSDSISRREFTEGLNEVRSQIDPLKKNLESMNITYESYKMDKAKIWVAMAVLLALGGTIITLSIMAINTKIKVGITEALSQYNIEVKN